MPILNTFILNITHLQFILSAFLLLLFIFKQSIFTYLHELGHLFALWITNKVLKLDYKINFKDIHVVHTGQWWFVKTYKGQTLNDLYNYLIQNKCYRSIRYNALAGFLFESVVLLAISAISPIILHNNWICPFTLITLIIIAFNFFTFATSSDGDIYSFPCKFSYTNGEPSDSPALTYVLPI